MWPEPIVRVFPGSQSRGHGSDCEITVITLPELLPAGAVEALDPAIELGGAGRQDVDRNIVGRTDLFELGHELTSPINLDGPDAEREAIEQIVEEGRGGAAVARERTPTAATRETTSMALNWRSWDPSPEER